MVTLFTVCRDFCHTADLGRLLRRGPECRVLDRILEQQELCPQAEEGGAGDRRSIWKEGGDSART